MSHPQAPTAAVDLLRKYAAARAPVTAPPVFVDRPGELEECCRRWSELDVLGVDTEFVRERTFYPALGLIQISDGRENVLIDPVEIEDLEALRVLFADERITKVFHSCTEDLEVLYYRFGEVPSPVFDTQIAAALAGLGYSLGLGGLVHALFDVEIPKEETRTNWLKRPLSPAQKKYAALDVAYLLPICDLLRDRLRRTGREAWAEEELELLRNTERFEYDPEDAFSKVRRVRGLDRRRLGVLRALAVWREREARRRDLPRNFVLRAAVLPELARKAPRGLQALGQVEGLRPDELRRHGRALVAVIRQAFELPREELPEMPRRPVDLSPYRRHVEKMRRAVADTARELELPAELLATRRTVERLARRALTGREPVLPPELRGWRREVIGERLLEKAAPLMGVL